MSKKKIKIPKSVLELRISTKKFAKKHDIHLKGKGMSKKERKHNQKRLDKEYAEFAISGLNRAVKIMAEHPDHKKIEKVKTGVENIVTNNGVMKKIAKLYRENPDAYPNMIYMPYIIMNTLMYYNGDNISDEEKAIGATLDSEAMIEFCEKVLKKEIKRYQKAGLSRETAYQLAVTIPTTKLFNKDVSWYRRLINVMYDVAANEHLDPDVVLKAVLNIDKKREISKKDFLEGFFSGFMLQKSSNKTAKYNDTQKELHDALIERTLVYLDAQKVRKIEDILKTYIKRRKTAESYKTDGKRVINFTDHANSNSPYLNIKQAVTEMIEDDPSNELYLK